MSQLLITNKSKKKDIYFKGEMPPYPDEKKIEKWEDNSPPNTITVDLKNKPKVKFFLYSKDTLNQKNYANYTDFTFTIGDPDVPQNVNISIKKNEDKGELITEWESTAIIYGKQKKVKLPPENVSVGVKE